MKPRHASLYVALFLSGAAALVHQTTWGRLLHRVFGVGDLAVATVLAAFFLGLGLGSAFGGRWAGKLKRPALTYAAVEVGIGLYALASLLIIPNVHSLYADIGAGASFGVLTAIRLTLALVILLPPTLLMGATLPILVKVVARSGGDWSSSATWLYATNTFGAMVGAGATGLYLVPTLGAQKSIAIAAAASLLAAALVAILWRRADGAEAPAEAADAAASAVPLAEMVPTHIRTAIVLAAVAGFAALASEVLWTRVLRIIVQGTTPAFAAMLVNYLFGIAVGSVIADRLVRRGRSPLKLFGATQLLLAGLTTLAMYVAPQLPRLMGMLSADNTLEEHQTWIVLVLASILLLPLALVLGTSIPLAWHVAGGGSKTAPAHAGRVLAWNTLGGLAGSLCAGFLLVPALGMEASILIVVAVHCLAAAIALRQGAGPRLLPRVVGLMVPGVLLTGVFLLRPSLEIPFLLHARNDSVDAVMSGPGPRWREQLAFLHEGRNTTVSIVRSEDLLRLYNDGRPESGFDGGEPGFGSELTVLGSLPTLFATQRDRAMVIGLGAGHTTTVMLGGPWQQLDVVELEGAVVDAARVLHEAREKPFPLDDPRTRLVVDDARARLVLAEPNSYDAIVSQPSHPWLAGSSALYTLEFFEEAKRALRPGGVIALWVNLFRTDVIHLRSVVATLLTVFPHAHAFVVEDSSFILCASLRPIPMDEVFARRARSEGLRPFLEPAGLDDVIDLAAVRELDPAAMVAFAGDAPMVLDDRPSLEFDLAQMPVSATVSGRDLDRAVASTPWLGVDAWGDLPEGDRIEAVIVRLDEVADRRVGIDRVALGLPDLDLDDAGRAYLEGAVAEARGGLRAALTSYDRAGTPVAALAADELRHAERMHWQLLRTALARDVVPPSAASILSSAIAVEDDVIARRALVVAAEVDDPADGPTRDLLQAWVDHGCRGLLASDALAAVARQDEHAAFLGLRCAGERRDRSMAHELADVYARVRRATAIGEQERGATAARGGNRGAALRHFRRALRANPSHGPAAAGLARLLAGAGREAEAAEVLRTAIDAAEGLPQSTGIITGTAMELGISLEPEVEGADAPPAEGPGTGEGSTAPSPEPAEAPEDP